MKSIISKIKNKDEIFVFILMMIISIGITLNLKITAGDEIWNFQNIYKMYNGFKIYEDINVITTPLFFICAKTIFHLFGANLFIFRISHCILMAILFLFTYKILKKLKITRTLSLLVILLISVQNFFAIIRTGFNYNNLAILITIIGIYLLVQNKSKKTWFIQGILSILIFLIKQNIGVFYAMGYIIFVMMSKNLEKNKKIKEILKFVSVIILSFIIFIIFLIIDNNLYQFLNYTFGGMFEFANKNIAFDVNCIIFVLALAIINIILSVNYLKNKNLVEREQENIRILFAFSLPLLLICYPIFNWNHGLLAIYICIINLVYIVYNIFKNFEKKIVNRIKILNSVFIVLLIIFSVYNMYNWISYIISDKNMYSWEDPFFGGIISKEEYGKNEKIIKYIKQSNKNVIVFSNKAALYMIPLKRNNGDFDLPFNGNLGIKGEFGLMDKIKNMTNVQFLIYVGDDEENYQETEKVKDYIKNVKKCVGKIESFDIYE